METRTTSREERDWEAKRVADASSLSDEAAKPGSIVYPDDSGLKRPLSLPRSQWRILAGISLIACVVGGVWAVGAVDSFLNHEARQREAVNELIHREVSLELPKLTDYALYDKDTIFQMLADNGLKVVDVTQVVENDSNAIDIVKIPDDMTAVEASVAFRSGINSMADESAIRYMTGSWRITQQNLEGVDMRVRYCDFSNATADSAIAQAMQIQGFDPATITDSGIDANNNTYRNGSVVINDVTYGWSINACPLNEVYKASGIPSTAQYVGIHLFQKNR